MHIISKAVGFVNTNFVKIFVHFVNIRKTSLHILFVKFIYRDSLVKQPALRHRMTAFT